jgi:hypothetical protein
MGSIPPIAGDIDQDAAVGGERRGAIVHDAEQEMEGAIRCVSGETEHRVRRSDSFQVHFSGVIPRFAIEEPFILN